MADDKQKNADFIDRVVGDAKNPPETRMLTGWFGDSGEEGYRRLYADAELSSYVDIPDDAILYSEPLRDTQPSGCVMVWIKRDAALKPGGSAASRAARFLQGQVQEDFASGAAGSLEKAGLRCATEVPCGEPTGFTGQCTKQPEVGGAWPCVTAIPHCFEVTGFTGKCTHAPWPNPSRYIGCTYLHCPTNDLTHIPHICNIVASGQPGCAVVNPPQGGDPAQKIGASADAEEKAIPATAIPGCGYTKTWGVCETHLLGCGAEKRSADAAPGAETYTAGGCTRMRPVCYPTEVCHYTQTPQCTGAAAQPASAICATAIACDITFLCHTRFQPLCFPTLICPTQPQQCFPIPSPFCPDTQACPFGPQGGSDPAQRFAFRAAAPVVPNTQAPGCMLSGIVVCPTTVNGCTVTPTSPELGCTQPQICHTKPETICTHSGPACPPPPTEPQTACTQSGPACPTSCGIECQSQQPICTTIGPVCGHHPCTQTLDQCPSLGIICTHNCPVTPNCPITTPHVICATPAAQAFAAPARPAPFTQAGCPPSDFVACSQFGGCPTLPKGDCTFFGCPSLAQFAAAGPGGGCTQNGPQCPTYAKPQCTFSGPACPPTPATVCTQFAPCQTHQGPQCPSQQFEWTMFCTHGGPGCLQTQNPPCFGPVHTGFNCPSQLCQSIACQSIACQPGGGGQEEFGFAQPQAAPGGTPWGMPFPTQDRRCFTPGCPTHVRCPPTHQQPNCTMFVACPVQNFPTERINCTMQFDCPTHLVALCPPPHLEFTQPRACPGISLRPPQCPPVSGFNCPSQIGCQSIACQSIACQPGGQREVAAFGAAPAAAGGGGGIGVTAWLDCTHFGWQCPPFFTQFEQQCVVQPNFTFDLPCLTPPPPTPACPTAYCPPKSHLFVACTAFGPQCPRTVVEAHAAQPAGGAPAGMIPHSFVAHQCFTFFNPCNTALINCWSAK